MRSILAIAFGFLVAASLRSQTIECGEAPVGGFVERPVAVDSVLVFSSNPSVSGELAVWARSEAVDLVIEVLDGAGETLASDEGVFPGVARLVVAVRGGGAHRVVVSARPRVKDAPPARGTCRVAAEFTKVPEDDEKVVAAIERTWREMAALSAQGRIEEARRLGRDRLAAARTPPEETTEARALALHGLGVEAISAQDGPTAEIALSIAVAALERTAPEEYDFLCRARLNLGIAKLVLGDLEAARVIEERVLAVQARVLKDEDPRILRTRLNLSNVLFALGDLKGATALRQQVLEVRERTLAPEDPGLQRIRMLQASTLGEAGDLAGARDLLENVLVVYERILPPDHRDLQLARANLARTLCALGETERPLALIRKALAVLEPIYPPHHPDLLAMRSFQASFLRTAGDFEAAGVIDKSVYEVRERSLPPDHPDLQYARTSYAFALIAKGDLEGAEALQRRVVSVYERTHPADHPDLQRARVNLSSTLSRLGDLAAARSLLEQVLKIWERGFPEDHPDLQQARSGLANALRDLGDFAGARALEERVLAAFQRTLPEANLDLQRSRRIYALTLARLGESERARALLERVVEVCDELLPADHPELLLFRSDLAVLRAADGDLDEAEKLMADLLEQRERTLPPEHVDLQVHRVNHSVLLLHMGRNKEAAAALERVLAVAERTRPATDPNLATFRCNLQDALWESARLGDEDAAGRLSAVISRHLESTTEAAIGSVATLSRRQACLATTLQERLVDRALSYTPPEDAETTGRALLLIEELRGAGLVERRLARLAQQAPEDLHEEVSRRRRELVRAESGLRDHVSALGRAESAEDRASLESEFATLVRDKEIAERALTAALLEMPGAASFRRRLSLGELAAALPEGAAGVSFRRFVRRGPSEAPGAFGPRNLEERLVAIVLSSEGEIHRIDLGAMDATRREISNWRALVGAPVERGVEVARAEGGEALSRSTARLAELLIAPVLEAAGAGVRRLAVSLDEDLELLPLDVLPVAPDEMLGDRLVIDFVPGLSWLARETGRTEGGRGLLAMGDIDFLGTPRPPSVAEIEGAAGLRESVEPGPQFAFVSEFRELPFSEVEVRAIAKCYERAFGDEEGGSDFVEPTLLVGRRADERRFRILAPRARYIHLATHGWFAPESIPSLGERREAEGEQGILHRDLRDEIFGYLPLELCGLALAGAGLDPDSQGRRVGLLSGVKIASMDLSGCELAVLSACETRVGLRRGGEGIASLQEALFMAGARSSITSLWKVPDEATMELMTRFYEGIWRRGETKREALWNAKKKLREAKDPATNEPRYGLKDWAGWVLVGNPE